MRNLQFKSEQQKAEMIHKIKSVCFDAFCYLSLVVIGTIALMGFGGLL